MLRLACWGGAALLGLTKLWAGVTGDLAATMAAAGDDPWGIVALVALYSGLIVLAVIVIRLEPNRKVALAVILGMPLVGNMAPAIWLAWRGLGLLSRPAGRG